MVLLKPDILTEALQRQLNDSGNVALVEQIAFLESQVAAKQVEDERLLRAYMAGAFDEEEFAEQRRFLKEKKQTLEAAAQRLRSRVLTREQIEAQIQYVLQIAEQLKESGNFQDAPFELQQQIIKLVVSRIVLNTTEGWFRLEGAVSGTYLLDDVPPDDSSDIEGLPKKAILLPSDTKSSTKMSSFATKPALIPGWNVEFVVLYDLTSYKPLSVHMTASIGHSARMRTPLALSASRPILTEQERQKITRRERHD